MSELKCTCTIHGSSVPSPSHGMFNRLPRFSHEELERMHTTPPPSDPAEGMRDEALVQRYAKHVRRLAYLEANRGLRSVFGDDEGTDEIVQLTQLANKYGQEITRRLSRRDAAAGTVCVSREDAAKAERSCRLGIMYHDVARIFRAALEGAE